MAAWRLSAVTSLFPQEGRNPTDTRDNSALAGTRFMSLGEFHNQNENFTTQPFFLFNMDK